MSVTKTESQFLQAFKGTNRKVPVWFMRQAGRYLPEYQAVRAKYSLNEMFQNPEVASEITLQPIDILGVDAAILFADILTLPEQMGFDITFEKGRGPVIRNPIRLASDVEKIHNFEDLSNVERTIQLTNHNLPEHIPLIGFAGSPFTVLTYLIEGGSTVNFSKTLKFAAEEPKAFDSAMHILTHNTIDYLRLQQKAGIKAVQLFDTWVGILREEEYTQWVLPYIKEIFQKVNLPSIYFLKGAPHLLKHLQNCENDFVSVCHTVDIGNSIDLELIQKGIQGNFYTGLLYEDFDVIEKEIQILLSKAKKYKKYIFNLSHGVSPDVDVAKLKFIVNKVHEFNWNE